MEDLISVEEKSYIENFNLEPLDIKSFTWSEQRLPSLKYILFNYRPSLFSKCLSMRVKLEKQKRLKLEEIRRSLCN